MQLSTQMKNTYCPRLWDEIFINQKGNVFSCCDEKPKVIGNIYKDKLISICNNEKIQKLREKSLRGQLSCFRNCTLLKKEEMLLQYSTHLINYNDLRRLKIEFGEACNINCIMCWQNHRSKEVLNYDIFIENVDILPFESIEIQGGEPFCIQSAKKFFDYAALKNKKVSFLTNGTLINPEWARKIAIYSLFVCFSLNAATKNSHESINVGSKWEEVLKNINNIRDAREKCQTQVKIIGHMTIIPENFEDIPVFIKKFREIGFDYIHFGYDMEVPNYLRRHPSIKKSIRFKIKETIKQCEEASAVDVHCLNLLDIL